MAVTDPEVRILLESGREAVERGHNLPTRFVIPAAGRRWDITCGDLASAGENDFGIPPRAFAYATVGMLLAALEAPCCYVMEPPPTAPRRALPSAGAGAAGTPATLGLVVTVFAWGTLEIHVQAYAFDHQGHLRWAEPTLRSTDQPTALGAALPLWRAANREPSALPPTEQLVEDMADAGFVIASQPVSISGGDV